MAPSLRTSDERISAAFPTGSSPAARSGMMPMTMVAENDRLPNGAARERRAYYRSVHENRFRRKGTGQLLLANPLHPQKLGGK